MKRPLLQKRFAIVLIIQTALMLLLWFHYHNAALTNIEDTSRENASLSAQRLLQEISSEFDYMRTVCSSIAGSVYVQDFLTETDVKVFYEKALPVSEIVGKAAFPISSSDGIVLINSQGEFYRFSGGLSNEACKSLYTTFQGEGVAYTVIELDNMFYFCHSNPVITTTGSQQIHVGNVVMLTAASKMRRLLESDSGADFDLMLLVEDTILLSGRSELEGKSNTELDGLYKDVIHKPIQNTKLEVGAALRGAKAAKEGSLFLSLSLAMAGLMLVTIILIYSYLFRDMVHPMSAILQNVRSIQDGTGRLVPTGCSDFNELTDSINAMLDRTERYHMGLLGTQINTHFIVNTLIFIQSLSKDGENKKAAQAAEMLAQLINHTKTGDTQINILEELAFLETYTALMNLRYDGKFAVELDIDERFCEFGMPSLLLQPIVENALTHGLRLKEGDCRLTIAGRCEEQAVVFDISDNGSGMTDEQMQRLCEKLSHAHEGDYIASLQHGVALCNIQRRIRLLYGGNFGVSLRSVPDEGTTVSVRLPLLPSP